MKVRVNYKTPQMAVDEVVSGATAEEVVTEMKRRVAARAGFAAKLVVNAMGPLQFAQEVVRRYNGATGRSVKSPQSCQEFLDLGVVEHIVTVLEP